MHGPMTTWRSSLVAAVLAMATAASASAATVTVFAAASLSGAFTAATKAFAAAHPGMEVQCSFASSSTLAQQILEGARADVLATADDATMAKVVAGGATAAAPQVFARNRLAILVAKGNPEKIEGLRDLARPGLVIALAAPAVPAGKYAAEAFAKAGVAVPTASQEIDVKAVVTRVALGEADAGIVYTTDVRAGGDKVEGIAIPEDQNVLARYPIAALEQGENPDGGAAFVAFVLSPAGQRLLGDAGFAAP
jgi:molybdate transport system substrate-binding protein